MGKFNKKSKKRKKLATKSAHRNEGTHPGVSDGKHEEKKPYTVDQLLDRVEEYIDRFEYPLAQRFCQRALEMDPDNIRALETSGTLLLEMGNLEPAKKCFGRAITLQPEEGHSKYMYMGQLMTGGEAIQCFEKGIELMKNLFSQQDSKQEEAAAAETDEHASSVTPRDVSCAYCAIAEIYMTDECLEVEAEERCQESLESALAEDASNPEAHHLMASFWLSKDDKQKAKECIEKGAALWLPQMKSANETEEMGADAVNVCEVSYPARLNAIKILVEVENYDLASEALELLLDENDEIVEVWYTLGWVNYLQGEDYKNNARHYLDKAKQVGEKFGCEEEGVMEHIQALLQELGPAPEEPEEDSEKDKDDNFDSDTESTDENNEKLEKMDNDSSDKDNKKQKQTTVQNHDSRDQEGTEESMEH